MKKILMSLALLSSISAFASAAHAYDRCEYISKGFAGAHSVELLKKDGSKVKVGNVKFSATKNPYIFNALNLQIIGDVLLPGAPKKVLLQSVDGECLLVGLGRVEDNTLGTIVEGEDMKVFSVQVEDESFESVSFSKIK